MSVCVGWSVAVVVVRLASQSQLSMMRSLYLRIMPRKASWSSRSGTVTVGGKTEEAYGNACRQPDGTWRVKN